MINRNEIKENMIGTSTEVLKIVKSNNKVLNLENQIIQKTKELNEIDKKINECMAKIKEANKRYEKDKVVEKVITSDGIICIPNDSITYYENLLTRLVVDKVVIKRELKYIKSNI